MSDEVLATLIEWAIRTCSVIFLVCLLAAYLSAKKGGMR